MIPNSHSPVRLARKLTRSGFTLVELVVALAVGGVAILGARSILATLADHADSIALVAAETDRIANGERMLRAIVGRLDISADSAAFAGDEHQMRFTSWCEVPSGWQERCKVTLAVIPSATSSDTEVVAVVLSTGEVIALLARPPPMRFRYLLDPGHGGRWLERWGAGITAPVAVGIVNESDTLIVRIGGRG